MGMEVPDGAGRGARNGEWTVAWRSPGSPWGPEWQLAAQEEEDEEEGGRTGEGDALLRVAAAEGVLEAGGRGGGESTWPQRVLSPKRFSSTKLPEKELPAEEDTVLGAGGTAVTGAGAAGVL